MFFCAVFFFKHRDSGIVRGYQVKHVIEGGRLGPLVGVITEDGDRHATGVCDLKVDI